MKLFLCELLQEFPRSLLHYVIQFFQDFHALGSDVRPDYPAILKVAPLAEEFLRL
jgi:hypothetical protein